MVEVRSRSASQDRVLAHADAEDVVVEGLVEADASLDMLRMVRASLESKTDVSRWPSGTSRSRHLRST